MSQLKNILFLFLALGTFMTFNACTGPGGNNPGMEYMPDMAHSVAYEANVYNYYYLNTWDSVSVKKLKELSMPRNPVVGTIPRGYAGSAKTNSISVAVSPNGSVPYHYTNTDAERARAMNEIIDNPFPISAAGLTKAKDLYNIFCGICHGENGDGNGWLVDEANPNAKYPAAPANFLQDTFYNSSNGRYYHAIMYGKGVMGNYKDKLSYEERWQVIHYIHSLQAKEKKLVYSETENTFSSDMVDVPGVNIPQIAHKVDINSDTHDAHEETGHDTDQENHSHDAPVDEHSHEGGEHE
ncbi:MAG: cytochrome c553 [Saprospiraceae bacterium]|jgi:cytochrome c553